MDDFGVNDHNMERARPYTGQPHTHTGIRGATEINGVTFRDLRDAFLRAVCLSSGPTAMYHEGNKGERAAICEEDVYAIWCQCDPIAVCQNLGCEIEKLMGIFPNIPRRPEQSK
jgi:hypothetical protein